MLGKYFDRVDYKLIKIISHIGIISGIVYNNPEAIIAPGGLLILIMYIKSRVEGE